MNKQIVVVIILLLSLLFVTGEIQSVKAININEDGTIAGTDKIQRNGDIYTLTDDIFDTIRVKRDNIVIDGAGYTLDRNEIERNPTGIIFLEVNDVTIKNFKITGFARGITLKGLGNIVTRCTITDCSTGIWLNGASNSTVSDNKFFNIKSGIQLDYSLNNQFRNNKFENGTISTGLDGNFNDIDPSNTIDGKPIYYLVNKQDLVISPSNYPELGYLALIKCTDITVKDLTISGTTTYDNGIILRYTTNSMISNNTLVNLWSGIWSYNSYNTTITKNTISNNRKGIAIVTTSANIITQNNIKNNQVGISLSGSAQRIYHNNFINNILNVDSADWSGLNRKVMPYGMHFWDNGYPSGGNFWSGHNLIDINNDDIGDTAYEVSQYRNNTDRYPLMETYDIFSLELPTPTPTRTSTPTPTTTPTPTSSPEPEFPTTLVIASVAVIAVVGLGVLAYYKKKRKP